MNEKFLPMKKVLRAALFVLLLSVAGMTKGYAYDFSAVCSSGQTLYYNIIDVNNRYVELTCPGNYSWEGFTKPTGNITLPTMVNYNGTSYSVKRIGWYAFYECQGLTGSLVIPNSVTTISFSAFYRCNGFTGSLTIPNSVTTLDAYAFYSCSGFTGSLTIPSSVTSIGYCAFALCSGFSGWLTIPEGVTSLEERAFFHCTGITAVNYQALNCADVPPVTVNHIPNSPFEECGQSLNIGNGVVRIPAFMFRNCTNFLGALIIPPSVTTIASNAFCGCSGFNSTLTLSDNLNSVAIYAFYDCTGFTGTLTIPNTLSTLGIYAFANCSGLQELIIGSQVNTMLYGAFYGCSNLASITLLAETPPQTEEDVFKNVPTNIPVYVPCSAMDTYLASSSWSAFTNYQCKPVVTVSAIPTNGGTVTGGGTYWSGTECTVTATPDPSYQFMSWSKDGETVSCNATYTFTVTEDTHLEALFVHQNNLGDVIGQNTGTSVVLPSYSYYKYGLTQQIYTAAELAGVTTIHSISFFNEGDTESRIYHIYMKHTSKNSFSSNTDWFSVSDSDRRFIGSVTMRAGCWTTIMLDQDFSYDGTSNLVLIVDDNSGQYTGQPHMACRVYNTGSNQALRIFSDNLDYDPYNTSSYEGALLTKKNQIMLNREAYYISAFTLHEEKGTVSGEGLYGDGDLCRLKATPKPGYVFLGWTDEAGVAISTEADYSFVVKEEKTLIANFMVDYGDMCSLTFDLHDSWGDGWNDNKLAVTYPGGTTMMLTVPSYQYEASFTLPFAHGDFVELSWILGSYLNECSFVVSYSNGNPICVGKDLNGDFRFEFFVDCTEQPSAWTYVGDHSTATNYYLPSYSYYNYSLSEQIYTAEEIGTSGTIKGIAFFNSGAQDKTRDYMIFLKETAKTAFEGPMDWLGTEGMAEVFHGTVTMKSGKWTPIVFHSPYEYDGSSNLAVIIDDNTGDYTGVPHMACLVYPVDGPQSLQIYSDETDYNPFSPFNYSGSMVNVKNQIMLDITPTITQQTVTLSKGWNWYSTYIEQNGIDGLSQLENSIGVPNAVIQSQNSGYVKSVLRNGTVLWGGALGSINNEEMYKIGTKYICSATMEGQVTDPSSHPITINKGWNWIGFPCNQSVSVNEALSGFRPKNGDVIKGLHSVATFSNGTWSGTLNTLEPGQGYMYGSKDRRPKTLVYQTGSRGNATQANITPENNHYQPTEEYADNMTLIAVVELDGEEMRSDAYELAAFAGDECRGSVKLMYVESIDRYVAFLTVFGDQEEELSFVLTDGENMNWSSDQLTFAVDAMSGTLTEPATLRFGTSVQQEYLHIFPNPSHGIFNIEGKGIRRVSVVDAYGQVVLLDEAANDFMQIDLNGKAAGVYMLQVVTDRGTTTRKLIKK